MHLAGHVGQREIHVVGIGPGRGRRGRRGREEQEHGQEPDHDRAPSVWLESESSDHHRITSRSIPPATARVAS